MHNAFCTADMSFLNKYSVPALCTGSVPVTHQKRQGTSGIHESCPIMYKVYPTFQPNSFFSPQLLHCIPERLCRPLVIRRTWVPATDNRLVEIFGQVSSIRICHCPHRPNYTPESAVLHSCSEVQYLVSNAPVCLLCCVGSREESKLGSG
jgi:hypothetical protein